MSGDGGAIPLNSLPRGRHAYVLAISFRTPNDPVARRLVELGFVKGERVQMIALGPFGGDPVAVRLGGTRFALRRAEAGRVLVEPGQ